MISNILSEQIYIEWLRKVSSSRLSIQYHNERLDYFRHKLIDISGDPMGVIKKDFSVTKYSPYAKWLDAIKEVEFEIAKFTKIIDEYESFKNTLDESERVILEQAVSQQGNITMLAQELQLSRTSVYTMKKEIYKKWEAFFSNVPISL